MLVGALAGTASAAFIATLEWATDWREGHVWMIGFLPLAGFAMAWVYHKVGREVEAGHILLIDEIHNPKKVIPLRMTPLIFVGSVITHLFGGSAGREGTAVQMGGSLADQLSIPFKLSAPQRRILLRTGISAGFASVFGTPFAGLIFGLEVLKGKIHYDAIWPCLVGALVADHVTRLWGIHHDLNHIPIVPSLTIKGFLVATLAGAIFGLVGRIFATTAHSLTAWSKTGIRYAPLRPFIGGCIVALLVWVMGTTRYIGLGTRVITESFITYLPTWDFAGKFLLTILTLGFGFKGGEVTPLFFIGATLGNTLSRFLPLPMPLLAGMGFVSVFAGAANTPLSCAIMAIELFGHPCLIYAAIACLSSYLVSGKNGIYHHRINASPKDI